MHSEIQSDIILKRFLKSREKYEKYAFVQKEAALKLVNNIIKYSDNKFDNTFEIGCGTGLLTKIILDKLSIKKLIVNDLSPEYQVTIDLLNKKDAEVSGLWGDIEKINNIPENNDLIISNAVFQWIKDTGKLIDRISEKIKKGTIFAFTTFDERNMIEIKTLTGTGLTYVSHKNYINMLNRNYEILYTEKEIRRMYFNSPIDILHHVRNIGANAIEQKNWNKKDLNNFIDKYKITYCDEQGVYLTYNPMFFILKKK